MALSEVDTGSLASSTQSGEIGACKAVNVSLSGTWVGTAALQRYIGGAWVTVHSWTANVETFVQIGVRQLRARLDFTRTSGTLVYAIEADDGRSAAVAGQLTLEAGDLEIGAVEIKDGTTDARAKVLAASTAAAVADTALVVAISPNGVIKAEDAAHVSGDFGLPTFGTRQDTPAATAGTTGDYQGSAYGAFGQLWAALVDGASAQVSKILAASTAPVATDPALVVGISPNGQLAAGRAAAGSSVPVVLSTADLAGDYEPVAASQTAQALGATGATGDIIKRVVIIPATVAPGVVTLLDNATSIPLWVGGTVGADLKPFVIDLGMVSVSGAWKITTGANLSVIAVGKFT